MDNVFSIEMTDLPITGGLSGDPSILCSVDAFLNKESHLRKVNEILQEDGCVVEYRSLIDCLLVQLLPQFEDACFEFYAGNGKPLANLYPTEAIEAFDQEIVLALEVLISREWPTWEDFKETYRENME
ncbi:MAG: hypothetical protein ACLQPD_29525 [Desulfomonilaceae bacterium]